MNSYQVLPPEVFLGALLAIALVFGAKAFSVPQWGVLALLFSIPFQKTAGSGASFLARFAMADVFTGLVLAGTGVLVLRGRATFLGDVRIPRQFLYGLALFLPVVWVSFFVSETPSRSIIEVVAYLANFVLFALIVLHVRDRATLLRCVQVWEWATAVSVAGALAGVILIFQGNFDTLLTNGPKVTSFFKKSGQLSFYLLSGLPLLWFNLKFRSPHRRQRVGRSLLIVLALFAVLATGSRTGFALAIGLTAILFGGPWALGALKRRAGLKLSAVAVLAMIAIPGFQAVIDDLPFTFRRAFSLVSGESSSSLRELSLPRYYGMLGFQVAAADYPLTGVGVGDFYSKKTSFVPGVHTPHEIHNTYLGVWAETGIFGIAALFVFYLGILQTAGRTIRLARDDVVAALGLALLIAWVTMFLYGFTSFGMRTRHMWAIFALIVAAGNVVWAERRPELREART